MSLLPVVMRLRDIEKAELSAPDSSQVPLGSNNVKYNTAYYKNAHKNDPDRKWCVVFQWWCFQKAGIPASIFPRTARVASVQEWYDDQGRFHTSNPMVGDLVIYKESHIGFVEKLIKDNRIQTIEGNYGDRVARRKLKATDDRIAGFCRPAYAKVADPERSPGGVSESIIHALPNLVLGSTGPDVRRLHALLFAKGLPLGEAVNPDGSFSREFTDSTRRALRTLTGRTTVTGAQWQILLGV